MTRSNWKWISAYLVVLALGLGGLARAQDGGDETQEPPPKPVKKLQTIFDYKAELGLTDAQEKDIRSLLADLAKALKLAQARLTILNYDIEELINSEEDLEKIKGKLEESAKIATDMRLTDIRTSRGVNKVLTPDQLNRWKLIQKKAREGGDGKK